MAEKYLYFRSDATAANDDDAAAGSNVYPLSSFLGMESTANSTMTLYFKPKRNHLSGGEGANADYLTDNVIITISTANHQKAVMQGLSESFVHSKLSFIVVADDQAGEYLHSDIASIGDFTVQAAQA